MHIIIVSIKQNPVRHSTSFASIGFRVFITQKQQQQLPVYVEMEDMGHLLTGYHVKNISITPVNDPISKMSHTREFPCGKYLTIMNVECGRRIMPMLVHVEEISHRSTSIRKMSNTDQRPSGRCPTPINQGPCGRYTTQIKVHVEDVAHRSRSMWKMCHTNQGPCGRYTTQIKVHVDDVPHRSTSMWKMSHTNQGPCGRCATQIKVHVEDVPHRSTSMWKMCHTDQRTHARTHARTRTH